VLRKRIVWLDGIKGWAAFMVFAHHFLVGFYPAAYFGDSVTVHFRKIPIEKFVAQSPIFFFLNGSFMVSLFCMISGIVLSLKVITSENREKTAASIIFKRYFRLMIPIFFTQTIIYVMKAANLFCSAEVGKITGSVSWLASFYCNDFSIKGLIRSSLFGVLFHGDSQYNTAFWMLNQLMLGGVLSVIFSMVIAKNKSSALWTCAIWLLGMLMGWSYYPSFILGTIIALNIIDENPRKENKWLGLILAIVGCFLGGYPTVFIPDNIYHVLKRVTPKFFPPAMFWHQVGAGMLIWGVYRSGILQKLFSCRMLQMLGKYSFSIYLIHIPIMCSFSCALFSVLRSYGVPYWLTVCIAFVLSSILLLFASRIYYSTVEKKAAQITEWISWRMDNDGKY